MRGVGDAQDRSQTPERLLCCPPPPIPPLCVQVNVVVMRGVNDDEVADFVELTRHAPINVRFIEYMPFDGNAWGSRKMVPYRELMATVNSRWVGWSSSSSKRWGVVEVCQVACSSNSYDAGRAHEASTWGACLQPAAGRQL